MESSKLLLPLLLLMAAAAAVSFADDKAELLKIAAALQPTPSGWSSSSSSSGDVCNWDGVTCASGVSITAINLARKSLTGEIPSFSALTSLQELYLGNNNFSSASTTVFKGLTNLQTLSLSDNSNLAPWAFPDITESTGLTLLALDNCNIQGPFPDLQAFVSLQNVRLSYNNFTGPLPASLGGSMIQSFWVNNQQVGLSGNVDVLGRMAQLTSAWLHKNQFTGPIPDLSNCTGLVDLQLRDNLLTGPVPLSLTKLPSLLNVSLSNNKLQGPVPKFPSSVEKVTINGTNNFCLDNGDPCDSQVNIMIEIAGGFEYPILLSDSWAGNDACKFSFVTCDGSGNVITINLAKKSLGGGISPAFGNLTSLKTLYLNDNNLTGPVPTALTTSASLQQIDVSNNNLSGDIPSFGSNVKFLYTGNPLLGKTGSTSGGTSDSGSGDASGGSGSSGSRRKNSLAMIIGIVIGVILVLAVMFFVLYKFRKGRRYPTLGNAKTMKNQKPIVKNEITGGELNVQGAASEMQVVVSGDHSDRYAFEGGNVVIPIALLREVTNNFDESNILGAGGFGVVYKGVLHDGTQVAIKRMDSSATGKKGIKEFQAEISVLTKVRHRYLVALLGYCITESERLLVYEYLPQGTLGQHLFEWKILKCPPLTWKQRVSIALDVARGVEYLHSLAQESFIHRDLKTSNILLTDDMHAKVADFGLVKNAPDGKHSLSTKLAGTFGYLAPEYAVTGRVTTKVDVYAFGVVLMELICGRRALDNTLADDRCHLVTWFRRILISKDVLNAIDETIPRDEETIASISRVAELAGHCTAREPYQRPNMGHAVNVLGPLVEQWKPSNQEDEESFGIDLQMSLPQALQRWQADEGTSTMYGDSSYSQIHFADTFSSSDCR